MHRSPPRILSLEPILRCPDRRCGEILHGSDLEMGSASVYRCERKKCRSHWWARRFEGGDLRLQLLKDYEDVDVVDALMALFGLPDVIDRPMYWQIWLTGEQYHAFTIDRTALRFARTLALFRKLLA